jgi:hypothetical protein|tara:strand:- start:455 stop:1450 length:996 start_codon:yes stop_codon:yes gene_type:complete
MPQGWRFNGGQIGGGPNSWEADAGGVWGVKENYINRNEEPFVAPSWPITSNAKMQYAFEAQYANSFVSNTAQSVTGAFGNVTIDGPTETWITRNTAATKTSYTKGSGQTSSYISLPINATLATNVNTFNGSDISSGGGYTLILCFQTANSHGSWGRMWMYTGASSGMADAPSSSGNITLPYVGSTFTGPLAFWDNSSNKRFQWRKPSNSANSGSYAYSVNLGAMGSSILSVVFRQKNNSPYEAKYWYRNRSTSAGGSLIQTGDAQTLIHNGNSTYGMKTTTNTARPVYNDYAYTYGRITNFNLIATGFANRAYTDQECLDVADYLDGNFGV